MVFLRVKPVRKTCRKTGKVSTYKYVYEVESYKHRGKVRQKTLRYLGNYIELEKLNIANFPLEKAQLADSREQLLKEIFQHNLTNYGFKQTKTNTFEKGHFFVDLEKRKVCDKDSEKEIYLGINGKFFGPETISRAIKSDSNSLLDFVKLIVDSGAVNLELADFKNKAKEQNHELKLLQIIVDKFAPINNVKMKEESFEKFTNEVGY